MRRIAAAGAIMLSIMGWSPADAGTKVWGFRGAGLEGWSEGVDQIAEQARHIPNVTSVAVFNYYETTAVYDQILAAKASDPLLRVAIFGYSCGANAAVVTANAVPGNINEVLGMQPSALCGGGYRNHLNRNIGYQQNTFAPCWQTFFLGCQRWEGGRRSSEIERPQRHLYADEDPAYQQDILGSIDYLANYQVPCDPARHRCHGHTLIVHRAPGGGITHTLIHR